MLNTCIGQKVCTTCIKNSGHVYPIKLLGRLPHRLLLWWPLMNWKTKAEVTNCTVFLRGPDFFWTDSLGAGHSNTHYYFTFFIILWAWLDSLARWWSLALVYVSRNIKRNINIKQVREQAVKNLLSLLYFCWVIWKHLTKEYNQQQCVGNLVW